MDGPIDGSLPFQTGSLFRVLCCFKWVHLNGRSHPFIGRFTSADPTTESPFSTQGRNRYSYVGNSPLNFTDPSGYCFMGCFWNSAFSAVQKAFVQIPLLRVGLGRREPPHPDTNASYALPVRQAGTLLRASFRFRIAPDTLAVG